MQGNLYVGVSAQVALQRRLETIAHNVANASTAGFRAEEVRFETLLSRTGAEPVAFATTGPSFLSRAIRRDSCRTDNLFDVAVEGDAWLGIQTPAGHGLHPRRPVAHDRTGELQTLNGYPVLDAGGTAMLLDPNGGPPASPATAPSPRPIARSAPSDCSTSTQGPTCSASRTPASSQTGPRPRWWISAGPACSRATSRAPTSMP